jgi:hypothetical protein
VFTSALEILSVTCVMLAGTGRWSNGWISPSSKLVRTAKRSSAIINVSGGYFYFCYAQSSFICSLRVRKIFTPSTSSSSIPFTNMPFSRLFSTPFRLLRRTPA